MISFIRSELKIDVELKSPRDETEYIVGFKTERPSIRQPKKINAQIVYNDLCFPNINVTLSEATLANALGVLT